jgi:NAD+ kinase
LLTLDGQAGLEIDERDVILIEKGTHPIYMMTLPGENYFDVLKAKLRWSGGRA